MYYYRVVSYDYFLFIKENPEYPRISRLRYLAEHKINLKTNKNSYIQINFDLLARFPRNNLEIVGTKGTIIIDRVDHYLKIFSIKDKSWKKFKYKKEIEN